MASRQEFRAVNNWVRQTTPYLNATLVEIVQTARERKKDLNDGFPELLGYENIEGQAVFTALNFCGLVSNSYGIVIRRRFPFVSAPRYLELYPEKLGGWHIVFGFMIDNDEFVLDGTYGQVAKSPNQPVLVPVARFDQVFNPRAISPRIYEKRVMNNYHRGRKITGLWDGKAVTCRFSENYFTRPPKLKVAGVVRSVKNHVIAALEQA